MASAVTSMPISTLLVPPASVTLGESRRRSRVTERSAARLLHLHTIPRRRKRLIHAENDRPPFTVGVTSQNVSASFKTCSIAIAPSRWRKLIRGDRC